MRQVTIGVATATLSKLIEAALAGEEVMIVKRNKPVARLVAIPQRRFRIGLLKGQISGPGPDFLKPMPGKDLDLWEGSV
jgi:prevent-host-death family protein